METLRVLDGLRAVSNLIIVVMHCVNAVGYPLVNQGWYGYAQQNAAVRLLINCGLMAVEAFFLLSGMLAALSLVPALRRSSPQSVMLRYYYKRLLRLYPALLCTFGVGWLLVFWRDENNIATTSELGSPLNATGMTLEAALVKARYYSQSACPSKIPLTVLCAQNYHPSRGCGRYLWSSAVQVQFYLAVPLVLLALLPWREGFLRRLAWLTFGVVLPGSCIQRIFVVAAQGVRLPIAVWNSITSNITGTGKLLAATYYPTHARLTSFALGALIGVCTLDEAQQQHMRRWLSHQHLFRWTCSILSTAVLVWSVSAFPFGQEAHHAAAGTSKSTTSSPIEAAMQLLGPWAAPLRPLAHWASTSCVAPFAVLGSSCSGSNMESYIFLLLHGYGPIACCAMAWLLLMLLVPCDAPFQAASWLLSRRLWHWPSELSYSSYLLHPLAMILVLEYLVPRGTFSALTSGSADAWLWTYVGLVLVLTYTAALLQYMLVEKPVSRAGEYLLGKSVPVRQHMEVRSSNRPAIEHGSLKSD